ncbi:serine/threonine-protein kinase [Thermocatellispora tengchongensis]|uniref:serine/threonine-protein kinase n=1 Tax=Thermocatellispora tengchongensis TaxID=1073253 RepID=UPI0036400127
MAAGPLTSPLTPDDPPRLGAYELRGRLGEGGQGVVYLGEGPSGEQVAVKALLRADAESRARLARELAAVESVAPFCTARVLDAALDGPLPYVVSEYVAGPSLAAYVRERGPLRGGELDRLAVGTATALAAIHAAMVVHRDFKPANVLLGPDGPRVVDFGIARPHDATRMTGGLIGTPAYLAPEQVAGQDATPASDVFAWAATMVFAATGHSPFDAGTIPAVLHRVVTHEADLSALPEPLRGLVAAGLAKDPLQRPAARDILIALVDPAAAGATPSTEELAAQGSRIATAATAPTSPSSPSRPSSAATASSPARPASASRPARLPGRPAVAVIAVAVVVAAVALTAGAVAWLRGSSSASPGASGISGASHAPDTAGTPGTPGASAVSSAPATSAPVVGPVLVHDTFVRGAAGGFGVSDTGGEWSVGPPADAYAVHGGSGRITMAEAGTGRSAYLGRLEETHTDLTFTAWADKPATGNGIYISAVGRKVDDAGTYRAHVTLRPHGGVVLQLIRSDADGAEHALLPGQRIPGLTVAAQGQLRVRVQVTGTSPTTVRGKVWAAGAPSPAGSSPPPTPPPACNGPDSPAS